MTFDDDGPLPGAGALPRVQGAGGGGGKSGGGAASSAPDTLFSTATVRLVDLLGEGEIVGVRGGLKGIYLNDVPVQNADGSLNFKGLTAEFRVGTPDQPYMAGYPDVQTPRNVGIKVNQATPVTASVTDTDVDRLRVTIQVPSLFLAKSDGSVRANSVSYRVEARYSGGPWVNSLGDQTITGKTTSGYFRSHEIALPTNPSGASAPWQVRVTRLSPDTDDFNNSQAKFTNQSDLVFYSTTSIVDARFSYPHSAMVGLTAQAASFGSSVPGRTYLVDGVLMPIPSNYDPVARTYSGVWDGTFKEGFSNNPAWALNLILRNDRFGLGEFIDTAAIDKWSLYEIGRYCDVPVSDGKGGQEPRYVFNGAISTQQEAFELLQLIAQVFRGTVYWSSGTVTAAQDRPADPVLLVTEANAIESENGEIFSYASSGRRARHTVALVAWNDPDNLYKQAIEVVEDSDGVARYGYNPTRIDLLGCTSRGQAHRTGLWTLFTELHQTQVLTYRAGLDHAVIRPGDIVAVQDPQIANLDLSGRLKVGSTASVLVLDRPVTLASGAAYSISVVMPDGTVQEREISTGAGTVSSVALRSALPQVPDAAAVWLIAGPVEPQLFRVVSIREEEPHIYAVAALQHEPGKYATIDDGAAFEPSPITEFPNIVLPPTNLSVRESQYTELGQPKQAMTLSWLPGQPFNSVAYYVTVIRPSGATVTTRTASQSIDFLEAEVGVWTFVVVAIGLNGKSSLPAQTTYTLSGWAGQAATTVAGLSVKGGGSTFTGRSCTVAWTNQIAASVPPYPVRNAVYVFDASTQVMVHREVLPAGVTEWTYDYFLNANEGGPRRQFRVGVTAYSAAGDEGPPSYLTVSNPAPEIIVPTLSSTSEVLFVDLPRVADADFEAYLVWVSETPNINPLTATPYDTTGNSFPYRGVPDKTYYVRAAAYDAFSKNPAQLNVSAELSKKLTILLFDPLPPNTPGAPTVASNATEIAPDGTVTAKVIVQWPAVTGTNIGPYEVSFAEGNNPSDPFYQGGRFTSGTTMTYAGLMPGRVYSFRVRTTPANGFANSGWSSILVVTAAPNAAAPANPTGVMVSAAYQRTLISLTPPANKDLAYIEVWAVNSSQTAASPTAGAVVVGQIAYGQTTFWDNLPTGGIRTYWLRSVNTSGVVATSYVRAGTATTLAIQGAELAAGIIDATKFASSLAANTVVAALPATKTTDYVTFGGEQYRWDAAAGRYTKSVAVGDISGKISAAQIDTVNAAQINGQVQAAQIAAVEAGKITGTLTSAQIASLDAAKVAGTLTAANIDFARLLGTIAGTQIAAASIVGSKLAVVSTNMAFNPDVSQGNLGYVLTNNTTGLALDGPTKWVNTTVPYAPAGFLPIYARVFGTPNTGLVQFTSQAARPDGTLTNYFVEAGQTYEMSACLSMHRASGLVNIAWYDANGAYISQNIGNGVLSNGTSGISYPNFPKSSVIAVAPAGAKTARLGFLMNNFTGSDPYMFASAIMFAATRAGATETSPYVAPGVTTIDGSGIVTNSITTRTIAASAVTTDQLAANSVVAGKIRAGAVETSHMTVGTIDASVLRAKSIVAGQLAANAVVAENILAGSITAGKLTLTDTSNMLLNGEFLNGSSEKWTLGGDAFIGASGVSDPGGQWRVAGRTGHYVAISDWVQVSPGDSLYLSAMMWNSRTGANGGIYLEYYAQDGTTNGVGRYPALSNLKNQWVRLEGRDLVPNGVQKVRVLLLGDGAGTEYVYFGKVQMRRAANASLIVDGAIETRTLKADCVTSDKIIANAINTAHITAGAVKADQIDAAAITAAKLGVGLNTGNLIWNSEREVAGFVSFVPAAGVATSEGNTDWVVSGVKGIAMLAGGANPNVKSSYFDLSYPLADGSKSTLWPIQAGQGYEWTCYLSAHRCRCYIEAHVWNGSAYVQSTYGSSVENVQGVGVGANNWRSRLKFTAPADAQSVILRVVQQTNGQNDAYLVASAPYFAIVAPGTPLDTYSLYTPQSRTVISGGQVATNSLNARSITAGTITTDRLQAGQINVDTIAVTGSISVDKLNANVLQIGNITISGGTRLSSWATGTQIHGGVIASNTILARSLSISTRGITPVNVNFFMERDGNGNLTGFLAWTGGQVEYINNDGVRSFAGIPAGRCARGTSGNDNGWVTVWWDLGQPGQLFSYAGNYTTQVFANPFTVLVATSADPTGVTVNWGGTIIDGDKITTNSIQARNIAANAIQTQHMAANSINGDRIVAGTLSAEKISTGTLRVNTTLSLGAGSQTDIYSYPEGGVVRIRNRALNQWRGAFGYIGAWTGDGDDFGMLLWGTDGVNRVRFSNAINFIDGVVILDATIQNAKIANLTLGNEKIQSEAVTRGAFNTSSAGQRDITTSLTVRNANTRLVIWAFRTGEPGSRYLNNVITGNLQIFVARPGMDWQLIREIPNGHCYEYDKGPQANYVRHMPTTDCCQWTTLEAGWHQFMVRDTSSATAPVVTVTVVEFSK